MNHGIEQAAGYLPGHWDALILLIVWGATVLVYGLSRSIGKAEPDPIRPSGPTGS